MVKKKDTDIRFWGLRFAIFLISSIVFVVVCMAPLTPDREMSKNSTPSLKSTFNLPIFYGLSHGAF